MEKSKKTKPHKVLLSIGLIAASAVYAFSQYPGSASPVIASSQSRPVSSAGSSSSSAKSGLYADGSYTGSAADAYYGTVQVKAVVQSGKIASVQFLQYPSSQSTSRSIDGRAMPILASEAIVAQSSQVNAVSGATFISQAFVQSLHSALVQAQA